MLPVAHFVYFKLHWHPGQYETHGPSLAQFGRLLNSLKGAMNADFLGIGILIVGILVYRESLRTASVREMRPAILAALALVAAGIVVYLPMNMMSGRYAMPAEIGGIDEAA